MNVFQIKSLSENAYPEIYKETTIVIFPMSGKHEVQTMCSITIINLNFKLFCILYTEYINLKHEGITTAAGTATLPEHPSLFLFLLGLVLLNN